MKNILTTIIISIIMTVVVTQAITYFDLPIGRSFSGNIVKDSSIKVVQERIEEFKKISNLESDVSRAIENGAPSVVSIVTTKELDIFLADPFTFYNNPAPKVAQPTTTTKKTTQKIKVWGWSGIIISKDWYILTNKHVVADVEAEYTIVTINGDTLQVKNIRRDPVLDIAVLQVTNATWQLPTDLQPATFVSYKSPVKIGQFTIAIGNALSEFDNSATFGIISAKNRSLNWLDPKTAYIGLYQTDTPINPGNSWWPLLNTAWEIIWMNTAMTQQDWIWFALPLSQEFIQTTLLSLSLSGDYSINRPFLGLETKLLTKAAATNLGMKKFEWVYVQTVLPWSPAAVAWIVSWDVITEINGSAVQTDMPLLYTLYTLKPNDPISFLVFRNKDYIRVEATLWQIWLSK